MKRDFEDYRPQERWRADACVIGAGAGGAAVACALAEAGLDVLVLEEGRHWRPDQFRGDSAWAYRNLYAGRGSRTAVGNCVMPLPGGRGVGGSTLINSAICFRTPNAVLREWVGEHGCERLEPDAMAPRLDRVWKTIGVTVNPVQFQRNNNLIFKAGADWLGLPGHWMPRSAPGCVGCGLCQNGCPSGGKASADRTFLEEAYRTGRARCHGSCRVEDVTVRGDRVLSVGGRTIDGETIRADGSFEVEADVFVVAAGPIGSPQLLLANGLADDTVCGRHLHVHPACGMYARFHQEIQPWSGVTQGFYVDRWDRGYLLQVYSASPDQLYIGMPYSLGETLLDAMANLRHMGLAGPLVHDDDSEGSVTTSALTYFLGNGDRGRLLAGMQECAEVFFAAGAIEVYAPIAGGRPIRSVAEIEGVIRSDVPARSIYLYASHPMGTCRMGGDRARSVVDPDGRVWGWKNLYVADASVFPTSLGVNPQVTVMAVALTVGERAAAAG